MEIEILNGIQQLRTPFGDVVIPALSSLANAGLIWIVLTIVLLIFPKTRKVGFIMAAALLLDLLICNGLLKPLVARTRPFDINTAVQLLISRPTDYSFPSGHTAASFAAASALFFGGYRKSACAAGILACLIAFSRLYLYVHFPTDVLGGAVVGILCGWLGCRIIEIIDRKRRLRSTLR